MERVYLVGIGGIGMSALARYFKHQGFEVAGYDRTSTRLTDELESEGIQITFEDDIKNIPTEFKNNKEKVKVIYTPAIPADNKIYQYFQNGYDIVKRSKALGLIAKDKKVLAVSGTHGKTTTSTMLAHLLTQAIGGCSAFLGGISKNYNTNLLLSTNEWLVAEADEYDRSFHQLYPDAAVITSTDPDHLDIYGTEENFLDSFYQFASQIKEDGTLLVRNGVKLNVDKLACKLYLHKYSLDEQATQYYASDIMAQEGGYYLFNLNTPNGVIENCTVGIPGMINVENAVAAMGLALTTGADPEKLKKALAEFKGVKRRFDFYINTPSLVYLDDYAHHPNELNASIKSVKGMFQNRKVTGIFQPHLYSRTKDFAKEFAESLSLLDKLILLDIYPARELPIEGVTSEMIFKNVTTKDKILCKKEELLSILEKEDIDVLVTYGAGDIDKLVKPIDDLLNSRL